MALVSNRLLDCRDATIVKRQKNVYRSRPSGDVSKKPPM